MSHKKQTEELLEEVEQITVKPEIAEEPQEDYKEKWQRALADLENMRRRTEQEKQSVGKYSLERFIEELLPVVDNFYRATEFIPEEQASSSWVMGIQYIQKNLLDVLDSKGVKEISAKNGDRFDAHNHEAIKNEVTENPELDQTITIINRGYMLHDRVIRPVQVAVYSLEQ